MLALLRLLIPFVLFPAVSAAAFRLAPAFYRLKIFASINILGLSLIHIYMCIRDRTVSQ